MLPRGAADLMERNSRATIEGCKRQGKKGSGKETDGFRARKVRSQMSDPTQNDPEPVPFHVRCEVTLLARSRSEALSQAAVALENWSDETGWKHIDGLGDPAGFVLVTQPDKSQRTRKPRKGSLRP